ncbi:Lrp/AsnC family transcriptional regulator [Saccharopolyspora taberi]|uniref:AsnC family transcriptional regulator n=1 Tax=Saccharopolyspora taberi TaxID=60895 RepID=A0ABN3VDW8_9PSEU
MHDDIALLGEDELALIHALQLSPRATWTELGRALGVDPVTAARRWDRLAERGEAWVSFSPGPRLFEHVCGAFLDVDCAAGAASAVARELTCHPHVLTLERVAGPHELLVTVATGDLAAMSRYTLDVLPAIPGVTAVQTRIITYMFTEGGRWQVGAQTPEQLTAPDHPVTAGRTRRMTTFDRSLLIWLARDGRASHEALAEVVGSSAAIVERRVDEMTRLGVLRFRCDFARPLGGRPVAVTFWVKVHPADLPGIGHALVQLPELRSCAAISGPHNLVLQASLHSVEDVLGFEHELATAHPGIDIAERVITLRHDKLFGHLLDASGRSVGVVPPDVWADPAPDQR